MSNTFAKLTLDEFAFFLERFPFSRAINAVHLHHTRRPRQEQFRGRETIVEIAHRHRDGFGFAAIAQHVTIAPDGSIWLGRHWNAPPVSAAGHNGNTTNGPFMISLIGDFDWGQDRLTEVQQKSVLHVIALIQDRFGLQPESLRFHRDMSRNQTSPGESIDYSELVKEVRKVRSDVRKERKQSDGMRPFTSDALELNVKLDEFSRQTVERTDPPAAEVTEDVTGSRDYYLYRSAASSTADGNGRGLFDGLNDEQIDEIRPHVINLVQGRFSSGGDMRSDETDVDALFEEHLPRMLQAVPNRKEPLNVVFYAHGGLVSERNALQQAYRDIPWWKQNQVYPIYFIWEIGFLETLGQLLQRTFGLLDRSATREAFFDPVVERMVRALRGDIVWSGMKQSAQAASTPGGGAYYLAQKLKEFCDKHGKDIHLHAIGHSAGSIFHSHFLPQAHQLDIPSFKSVQFLAPALTVAGFKARLKPLLKKQGIDHLSMFTLRKELELNDKSAVVYGKSILYLIHHSLEAVAGEPLLGLEVSLRGDNELKEIFGLRSQQSIQAEVIWAKTRDIESGRNASQATTHSSFNDDRATMNSVLRRVLGKDDNDPIIDFPLQNGRSLAAWDNQFQWPPELAHLAGAAPLGIAATTTPAAGFSPIHTRFIHAVPSALGGRKRALCVGINQYSVRPLRGCVPDANRWAQILTTLGFESPTLLLDGEATRKAIMDALITLVTSSQAGDVVVFQYSGHGTELPDHNGDESGQDTTKTDEAICPIDFTSGAFIIDDDIAEIFARTPAGVNVTCFIDCCHSGTISRFAVGASDNGSLQTIDQRERFVIVEPAVEEAHIQFRRTLGRSLGASTRGPQTMREIVFSACRSDEVAWETDGKGDFTTHATEILRSPSISNQAFQDQVVRAFGPAGRQHPVLDCAPTAYEQALLQPITVATAPAGAMLPPVGNRAQQTAQLLRMALAALEQGA